jgi:hypothetical protein
MAQASPIDEATRGQTSYLGLSDEQRRAVARGMSELDVFNQLGRRVQPPTRPLTPAQKDLALQPTTTRGGRPA